MQYFFCLLILGISNYCYAGIVGNGTCSGYPAAIDTSTHVQTNDDYATKEIANDWTNCILAIEGALGINPASGYSTVAARLQALTTVYWQAELDNTGIYYTQGNVGIGTTNPGVKLDILNTAGTSILQISTSATLGINALFVDNYNRVGIGTTNPGYKLSINSQDNIDGIEISAKNPQLLFTDKTVGEQSGTIYFDNGEFIFTNSDNRLWIKSNGYVGIGISTPSAILDVNDDVQFQNKLDVNGTSTFGSSVTINGNLKQIAGNYNTEISTINITGGCTIHNWLNVFADDDNGIVLDGINSTLKFNIVGGQVGAISGNSVGGLDFRNDANTIIMQMDNNGNLLLPSGQITQTGGSYVNSLSSTTLYGGTTIYNGFQVTDGHIRGDLNAIGESMILTGTGSNFQVVHDGIGNPVKIYNSGGTGFHFKGGSIMLESRFGIGLSTMPVSYGLEVATSTFLNGGVRYAYTTIYSTYSVTLDDYFIVCGIDEGCNYHYTITLPAAIGLNNINNKGRVYIIGRDGNESLQGVTILPSGTETINGNSSIELTDPYDCIRIVAHFNGWFLY